MKKAGGGVIVNVASIGGIVPGYRHGAYSASKSAVMTLTEQMALEWAPYGIRVNAVAPGMIDAGMGVSINADPQRRRRRDRMIPLGRQGTAEDVADAVAYLASDRAAYVTGHTLVVDGALTKSLLGSR
jgi:NAD(P)-dependent dehydrogenase (short-subunit alcohol dehydrogenase family)